MSCSNSALLILPIQPGMVLFVKSNKKNRWGEGGGDEILRNKDIQNSSPNLLLLDSILIKFLSQNAMKVSQCSQATAVPLLQGSGRKPCRARWSAEGTVASPRAVRRDEALGPHRPRDESQLSHLTSYDSGHVT